MKQVFAESISSNSQTIRQLTGEVTSAPFLINYKIALRPVSDKQQKHYTYSWGILLLSKYPLTSIKSIRVSSVDTQRQLIA